MAAPMLICIEEHQYINIPVCSFALVTRLAKYFHVIYHSTPIQTSPLFWNASYLVQSDHHQGQRNDNDILQDILQELTRCMHWNDSTPIITDRTSLPKESIFDHEHASDSISLRQNFLRIYGRYVNCERHNFLSKNCRRDTISGRQIFL